MNLQINAILLFALSIQSWGHQLLTTLERLGPATCTSSPQADATIEIQHEDQSVSEIMRVTSESCRYTNNPPTPVLKSWVSSTSTTAQVSSDTAQVTPSLGWPPLANMTDTWMFVTATGTVVSWPITGNSTSTGTGTQGATGQTTFPLPVTAAGLRAVVTRMYWLAIGQVIPLLLHWAQ